MILIKNINLNKNNKNPELNKIPQLTKSKFKPNFPNNHIPILKTEPNLNLLTLPQALTNYNPKSEFPLYSLNSDNLKAGNTHSCLITPLNRILRCWGSNDHNQSSIPSYFSESTHSVSLGYDFTCASTTHLEVHCWGLNSHGQCDAIRGMNNNKDTMEYANQNGKGNVNGTIESNNHIYDNDQNTNTNIDSVPDKPVNTPYTIPSYSLKLAMGFNHGCSISLSSSLSCWGSDTYHQSTIPEMTLSQPVSQVSLGYAHTCMITKQDGQMLCWGFNSHGQTEVPDGMHEDVFDISTKVNHTCAIRYGFNAHAKVGIESEIQKYQDGLKVNKKKYTNKIKNILHKIFKGNKRYMNLKIKDISSSYSNLTSNTLLKCWGLNSSGQTAVPLDLYNAYHVVASSNYTCAVALHGHLVCWGSRHYYSTLIPAPFNLGTLAVAVGLRHTVAIDTRYNIHCWGKNDKKQCEMPQDLNEQYDYNVIDDYIDNYDMKGNDYGDKKIIKTKENIRDSEKIDWDYYLDYSENDVKDKDNDNDYQISNEIDEDYFFDNSEHKVKEAGRDINYDNKEYFDAFLNSGSYSNKYNIDYQDTNSEISTKAHNSFEDIRKSFELNEYNRNSNTSLIR